MSSRLHALLWEAAERRQFHRLAQNGDEADGGEAARPKAELIRGKHEPPAQVGEWLTKVVQGYYQYHAVPGNLNQLSAFRHRLCRLWRAILNRRSQRGERPWQRLNLLLERWIPLGVATLERRPTGHEFNHLGLFSPSSKTT